MSGPKHTPLVHLGVELDDEEAQDVIDTLQDLADSQERDIERLAEALKRCDSEAVWDDLVGMWLVPNEVMDEIRAALREAGVE